MRDSAGDSLIERVNRAVHRGELWRAKEILQGSIATRGYEPLLYEQLGLVLQRMGDLVEAGKYLFLSGVEKPEYEQAINLFVHRYTRKKPLHLYHTFPRAAQLERLDAYPPQVASRLTSLGLPQKLRSGRPRPKGAPAALRDKLMAAGCFAVAVLFCIFAGIGVFFIFRML